YLRQHTQLELVDLRRPLREAKRQGRLYFRRDTHWNDRGAFAGYQAIVAALGRWYPAMVPASRSDFREVPFVRTDPDLSLMLGLADVMPDHEFHLEPIFARRAHLADPGPGLRREDIPVKTPVAMESGDASLPRAVFFD